MLSKKWLINICLAGLAVFIGIKANDIWSQQVVIPADTTAAPASPAAAVVKVAARDQASPSSYDLVVERNLFAPEREEIIYVPPKPKKKPPPKKKKKVNKAQERAIARMVLLGVVLADGQRSALVRAAKKKGKGSGVYWVVEGDELEGMQVAEIRDEKIRLTSEEEDVELLLYDPDKPKKRGLLKKQSKPTVLATGGGAAPRKAVQKKQPRQRTPRQKKALTRTPKPRVQQSKDRRTNQPASSNTGKKQPRSPRSGRVKADLYEKTPS